MGLVDLVSDEFHKPVNTEIVPGVSFDSYRAPGVEWENLMQCLKQEKRAIFLSRWIGMLFCRPVSDQSAGMWEVYNWKTETQN